MIIIKKIAKKMRGTFKSLHEAKDTATKLKILENSIAHMTDQLGSYNRTDLGHSALNECNCDGVCVCEVEQQEPYIESLDEEEVNKEGVFFNTRIATAHEKCHENYIKKDTNKEIMKRKKRSEVIDIE